MARLCSTRLNRATSAYSSACQSCDSICVVSGFQVRPRCSTNALLTAGQSAPGTATTCAPYVPVAPLSLPRYSSAAIRAQLAPQPVREDRELLAERRRRGRLPVREGEQRLVRALVRERGDLVDERRRGRGSHTSLHRAADHERVRQVVDVLARAREVHELADVVQRASPAGAAASRLLRKYSTALTSCTVMRSISASSATSSAPNVATTSRR